MTEYDCLTDGPQVCWAFTAPPPGYEASSSLSATCEHQFLGMCLVEPPSNSKGGVFGFAEFVQAFALLVVIYTVSDVVHRFRVAVAPIPLIRLTFISTAVIGGGTLLSDILFGLSVPMPRFLSNQIAWQAFFGLLFLCTVIAWLWYAFIRPPIFGKRNFRKYTEVLYAYILRGSDSQLPAIAGELARSADAFIAHAHEEEWRAPDESSPVLSDLEGYTHDLLLLLGSRKLCRALVAEAPGTAIAIFHAMTSREKYRLPLGQFASNVTSEALINKDSMLYHEDPGYQSGLFGYIKPFTKAMYGDFRLVEQLASQHNSPLDVNLETRWGFDEKQFEAYCRCVFTTVANYIADGHWGQHSYALRRAFSTIKDAPRGLYKLDGMDKGVYESVEFRKLQVAADFIGDVLDLLDERENNPRTILRHRGDSRPFREDLYDMVARMFFELVDHASTVKSPPDQCWTIQHNTVWSVLFSLRGGPASKIVQFKVRRLLFEEVLRYGRMPNYKSTRILGFCLNVMGLGIGQRHGESRYGIEQYALRRAVLSWTKQNWLAVRKRYPEVADAGLLGSITYDAKGHRLVKTYLKGPNRTAPRGFLVLDRPPRQRRGSAE